MTVCFSEKHEGLAPVSGRSMMADVSAKSSMNIIGINY